MKRTQKAFTLIELLIVIIIIGVLGAGLLLSSGQAVGAAKAATITSNIAQIKNGAMIYYTDHVNSSDADISDALRRQIRRYVDISKFNKENENIKYDMTPHGSRKEWTADCDFTNDPDRDDIKAKLLANREFYFIDNYSVQVKVFFTGDENEFEEQGNTSIARTSTRYGDSAIRTSGRSGAMGGTPANDTRRRNSSTASSENSSGYGRASSNRRTGNDNLSLYTSSDISFDSYLR